MVLDSSVMIRSQDDGEIYARKNDELSSSLMERLFPWIQTNPDAKICNNVKDTELVMQKTKDKNSAQPTMPQETNAKTPQSNSTKTYDPQLSRKAPAINNTPQGVSMFDDSRRVSVLEMWNLIESVGIKREMVDKVLTTDEAIAELYHTIERRIHYEREQDMIKRLKEHIAKRKKVPESGKSTLFVKTT
jgi:hypothetical protein